MAEIFLCLLTQSPGQCQHRYTEVPNASQQHFIMCSKVSKSQQEG